MKLFNELFIFCATTPDLKIIQMRSQSKMKDSFRSPAQCIFDFQTPTDFFRFFFIDFDRQQLMSVPNRCGNDEWLCQNEMENEMICADG
jgi:hypothetical protein